MNDKFKQTVGKYVTSVFKTAWRTQNYSICWIYGFVCRKNKHEIMLLNSAFISVYASLADVNELVIVNMTGRCNNICMHWKYKEVLHIYGHLKKDQQF